MTDFKQGSDISQELEEIGQTTLRNKSVYNIYEPKDGVVKVTLSDYDANIKVVKISAPYQPIVLINGHAHKNQFNLVLLKSEGEDYSIEAGFINSLNGAETKLNNVKKLHAIIDPSTNLKIEHFEFFNDDTTHPSIIIEMSDTP